MNTFVSEIENAIKKTFEEYSILISEKYSIDKKELENVWNDVCKNTKISLIRTNNEKVDTKIKNSDEEKVSVKKVEKEQKTSGNTCPYIYTKGQNAGEVCGSKPKSGCEYCSKHSKFEGVGQQEKKKLPKAKSISSESVKKSKSPSKKPLEKVIRLNKEIDKWWNTETQLVFKSRDERIVVGSYRDDKLNDLTDDDILLCEQYGFKYENMSENNNNEDLEDNIVNEKPVVNKKKEEIPIKQIKEQPKKLYKTEVKKVLEEKKINNLVENVTEKKTIKSEINKNNIKAKDIESVLNELQFSADNDFEDDDELIEEEEYLDEDD